MDYNKGMTDINDFISLSDFVLLLVTICQKLNTNRLHHHNSASLPLRPQVLYISVWKFQSHSELIAVQLEKSHPLTFWSCWYHPSSCFLFHKRETFACLFQKENVDFHLLLFSLLLTKIRWKYPILAGRVSAG